MQLGEEALQGDVYTHSAVISACGQGQQWQRALLLLTQLLEANLQAGVATVATGLTATTHGCHSNSAYQHLASSPCPEQADPVTYTSSVSACALGEQWEAAALVLEHAHAQQLEGDVARQKARIT